MSVNVKGLIWVGGRLILAERLRYGRKVLSLPGGRVREQESVLQALRRGVAEETGLAVEPGRLVYVYELAGSARRHELELIFLAELHGVPRLNRVRAIDVHGGERPPLTPSILDLIVADAASEWRDAPRWLDKPSAAAVGA